MTAVRALTICGKLKHNKEFEIIIIYIYIFFNLVGNFFPRPHGALRTFLHHHMMLHDQPNGKKYQPH